MENKYDVIIVGTGVAGCFAALHLPCDKKVLMITKGELEESDSFLAQGGICVLRDENDFDDFFDPFLIISILCLFNNKALVKMIVSK